MVRPLFFPPPPPMPAEVRRGTLIMPFPLDDKYVAQVHVPRNLKRAEADRLCTFIKALVMPEEK